MMPILCPTVKQYEQDAFATSLCTTLCGIAQGDANGVKIALTQTIFFAQGGGQPADCGRVCFTLTSQQVCANVLDVHEQDGILWHTLDCCPDGLTQDAIGCAVQCTLDWAHRFDSMQQHTGEHILSGVLHGLYGAENVGFHIGSNFVRMDTSCPLTAEQLQFAEQKANEIIWQNVPIETLLPTPSALADMTYRSKKEIDGQVRIVRIAGADTCACCGTHLQYTGQVGQIKILATEHYKGGERLSVACGKRALAAAQGMRMREAEIGALLSAKPDQTASAVQRVYQEYNALKFAKQGVEQQLFEALASNLSSAQTTPAIVTVNGLTPDGLHQLASVLCGKTKVLCAALCEQTAPTPTTPVATLPQTDAQGYGAQASQQAPIRTGYCLAQQGEADLRPLCKALNTALQGRGGGKPNICQGSVLASAADVTAFLQNWQG